jgi:hypothetical protein
MKKEELRIGNYVTHKPYGNRDGEQVKIAGMLGMQAYFNKNTNEGGMFHNLYGIPLTPSILEKAGFEKKEYAYTEYKKWVGETGFSFEYRIRKGIKEPIIEFVLYGNGGYDDAGEMSIFETCKYVHQLQNLYFALTGTELEINI